jgi:hypothetical protein
MKSYHLSCLCVPAQMLPQRPPLRTRAARGHAAAPPIAATNARRFMPIPLAPKGRIVAQIGLRKRAGNGSLEKVRYCNTGRGRRCPLWVISRHCRRTCECPLYPQKRTSPRVLVMSAKCQKPSFAHSSQRSRAATRKPAYEARPWRPTIPLPSR